MSNRSSPPRRVAIITARGGSKRLPRKNIKMFNGQPVISYGIKAALDSQLFDEVMVSTDDDEIAEIAQKYGANVPFRRSDAMADDFATTADVLLEVLEEYSKRGEKFDFGLCLYPTAAFVTVERIKEAYALLTGDERISVFSATPYPSAVQRCLRRTHDGKAKMMFPEFLRSRSQDLDQAYYDCGQLYWFDVSKFQKEKVLYTENSSFIEIPAMEAHDIDTIDDWEIAEFKFKYMQQRKERITK